MKVFLKKLFDSKLYGEYVKRYRTLYLSVVFIIAIFEIAMIIRGCILFDFSKTDHVLYFSSYIFLLVCSLFVGVVLIIDTINNLNTKYLSIVAHFYSFAIIAWSTLVSYLDLLNGNTPIVYFTIIMVVAGIVIVNPIYYFIAIVISVSVLMFGAEHYHTMLLEGSGYVFNFFVFIVMSIIMAYRQFRVSLKEMERQNYLKKLSYTDALTGLGNETAYIDHLARIEAKEDAGKAKYAVLVMDVNGVKITNDKYGHRFGCHLIVTGGKTIANIFKDYAVYHIGGDEYVVIAEDENLDSLASNIEKFKAELEYKPIKHEGKDIFLSLAIGYAYYEPGMKYQEVFQRADDAMYENKVAVKKLHNIPGR